MLRLHFAGFDRSQPVIALASACGLAPETHSGQVDSHRFDALFSIGPELWTAVPEPAGADVVVYPHRYLPGPDTEAVASMAKKAGVPCLFFRGTDDMTPANPSYGYVYRESILSDQQTPVERAMPAFSADFRRGRDAGIAATDKGLRPSLGFCGHVGNCLSPWIYRLTGREQNAKGLAIRQTALRYLERHGGVDCRFIRRRQFWGGTLGSIGSDLQRQLAVRQEYVENLFSTEYTLCVRGAGNFSFRFYEVLSAGRIPLFINTRCVLPFAEQINWRRHCVWVEERDLPRIGEILVDFHAALTPESFRELQVANRTLWEQWLSPLGAYRRILEHVTAGRDVTGPNRVRA